MQKKYLLIPNTDIELYTVAFREQIMLGLLWAVVVVLVGFWAIGLALHIAGNLIHIALVLAIGLAIYNFFSKRDV
jgi:EamA domain-containing membrane protein RarD